MSASAKRRRRMVPGILASAAVLMASAGTAAAVTGNRPGGPLVNVAQGSGTAALASGTVVGATDPNTPEDVSFILRARNLAGLEKRVQAGWGGAYLSTAQFAAQYGQSPLLIRALETYLQSFGISTSSYADHLDVSAHGTAGQFDKALSIAEQDFRVRAPAATLGGAAHWRTVHGTLSAPRVPADLGSPILAILGLSNYSPFVSQARKAPLPARSSVSADTTAHGVPAGELAPADFVNRYHLSSLEKSGALGQGTTVGIVTLAAIDPSVPLAFWNTYLGLHEPASRLTLVPVDGGAPGPSAEAGTIETDLDVEQSGAIAPKAHVRVYNAPNTDAGFADAFFAAASDNIADTVSASWGESETVVRAQVASGTETAAYAAAFDEAFAEFGAQGQSDFAASGDSGAYDAAFDVGSTSLAVDEPASSPEITAAGGTTLPFSLTLPVTDSAGNPAGTESVRSPVERAWSWDYLWPLYRVFGYPDEAAAATDVNPATSVLAGDGGGYSSVEARPAYQRGISGSDSRKYLTSTSYVEAAPGVFLPTQFVFNPAPSLRYGYQPGRTRRARRLGRCRPEYRIRHVRPSRDRRWLRPVRRDELRRAAAQRRSRGDRQQPRAAGRILEPQGLPGGRGQRHPLHAVEQHDGLLGEAVPLPDQHQRRRHRAAR